MDFRQITTPGIGLTQHIFVQAFHAGVGTSYKEITKPSPLNSVVAPALYKTRIQCPTNPNPNEKIIRSHLWVTHNSKWMENTAKYLT